MARKDPSKPDSPGTEMPEATADVAPAAPPPELDQVSPARAILRDIANPESITAMGLAALNSQSSASPSASNPEFVTVRIGNGASTIGPYRADQNYVVPAAEAERLLGRGFIQVEGQ